MAFVLRSLVLEHSVPHSQDLPPINWYKYATPDAVATVTTAGYFNSARDKIRVNDTIDCMCVTTGVGARQQVTVTAVPVAPGNITVSVDTDAAGA